MQISSRFTMAIHMFACIDTFSDQKMTSDFMAASIGTNPVIIRKILQQLKAAGLIEVARGTGGVKLPDHLIRLHSLMCIKRWNVHQMKNCFIFMRIPIRNVR